MAKQGASYSLLHRVLVVNMNGKRIYIFFVYQNSRFLLLYITSLKYPMSANTKYKILSNITILQTVLKITTKQVFENFKVI